MNAVKINNTNYRSAAFAAKTLYENGKTVNEIVKMIKDAGVSIKRSTIVANTSGKARVDAWRMKDRVIKLSKSGKRTPGDIAKKTGISVSKVVAILKKADVDDIKKDNKNPTVNKKVKDDVIDNDTIYSNDNVFDVDARAAAFDDMKTAEDFLVIN